MTFPPLDDRAEILGGAAPPAHARHRPRGRVLFPVAAGILGLVVGVGVGATRDTTPAACGKALTKADEVMALDDEAFGDAAAALSAIDVLTPEMMDRQTALIERIAPLKQDAAAQYERQAQDCRKGGASWHW